MCPSIDQCQGQDIVFNQIDQQPVRLDVALTEANQLASQCMITIFTVQLFTALKQLNDMIKKLHLVATLLRSFVLLLEGARKSDLVHHSSRAFFNAETES